MLVLTGRERKLRTHSTKQQEAAICLIVISRVGHSLPLLNLAVYPLQVFLIATDDGQGDYLGGDFKMLGVERHYTLHNPMFCRVRH